MSKRYLPNWLKGLQDYVEETEAPRDFWLWGGIFTLCATLQRRVWLPYGIDPVYPNIYILLVAPPGKCRKGGPPSLAKKMLKKIDIPVSIDSSSKRALTKELASIAKTEHFTHDGKTKAQTPLAIISKEMSSLLAVDPKGMIEVLTDLYDSHDEWEYGTSGQGEDKLYGVCLSCFIATTPSWLAANLPQEAIGGGYTSRHIIVTGYDKYKLVPIPPAPDERLYSKLIHDLGGIATLSGEFKWASGSKDFFDQWYRTLPDKLTETKDDRLHSFIERMHIMVLKTAMALKIAQSNELTIGIPELEVASELLDSVLKTASDALGGHGRSLTSLDVDTIMKKIKLFKTISFTELLQSNYRNTSGSELAAVMETIIKLKWVAAVTKSDGETYYTWKGGS